MEVEEMQNKIESMMPTPQQIVEHPDSKLEEARRLYKTANSDQKYVLESLYPQLSESEDDRIRKELIFYLGDMPEDTELRNGVTNRDVLAWLEKQGEQKTDNKIIEEEKPLLEKFKQAVYDCAWGKVTCKKEGETKEEYADRWAEQFLLITRDWADDYIDFTIQQKLRNSYEKGKKDIIEKLHEQQLAWTEEDEKIYNLLYEEYKNIAHYSHSREKAEDIPGEVLGWLKSLKYRVQLQPKQEWSKEDEEMIGNIRRIIAQDAFYNDAVDVNGELCEKMYIDADNWLKSLKNRIQPQSKQE